MSATELLKRAHAFVRQARTWDWNEDRCVMGAIHLEEDIRAYLIANSISPASAMSAGTAETPQEAQGKARQREAETPKGGSHA